MGGAPRAFCRCPHGPPAGSVRLRRFSQRHKTAANCGNTYPTKGDFNDDHLCLYPPAAFRKPLFGGISPVL